MTEQVILVDESDNEIGTEEKMEAHTLGLLHRAFSIFVYNTRGEMLLQKRALSKYHSGGLWTNTCCSHPRPGESIMDAAHRKLVQEMGFDCPLTEVFSFTYKAGLGGGLTEHEFDHVFIGSYDGDPLPNPEEADGYKWIDTKTLTEDIAKKPESYTIWFRLCLQKVLNSVSS